MAKKSKAVSIAGSLTEKEVKDYAQFFSKNKLDELKIEEGGVKIQFKKETVQPVQTAPVAATAAPASAEAAVSPQAAEQAAAEPEEQPEKAAESKYKEIKSPIVGSYYSASSPDADPYISVGDKVSPTTKVCIIEAMKIMNEIQAGISGKVVEILVENGQQVQVDQVLMHVE